MQAKIESIRLSHIQTRSSYKEETINDLANSIKEYGILEPLIVREVNNGFELIAGCRRLRAAQKVGLTSVPIEVKKLSDDDVLFVQLIENIQREEISDYDVGKIFSELSKKLTQQQIAEKVGFSIRHIQRFIEHYKFCESSLRPIGHNVVTRGRLP